MEYRTLGKAGVKVSPLCLGSMNFGDPTPEDESIRIIHRALDAGINFIDTANVYNRGVSETIVGKAIQGRRDNVVLATKVHFRMGEGPNDRGNSRYHIVRQVEASLKRLNTDRIDLYQIHRPDPDVPIEETLRVLTDLVRQGKVLYLGTSAFPAWQICEALWVSEKYGLEKFSAEQPPYSILDRRIENEVLPLCKKYGIGTLVWSPLEGGWLAGIYKKGQPPPEGTRAARWKEMLERASDRKWKVVEKVEKMAEKHGCTVSQFGLAWTLVHPAVTCTIIGPRTVAHLEDHLGTVDVTLSEKELKAIDELVPPGTRQD